MRQLRIAVRTDASIGIGSGHVVRCMTLSQELRRRGAEVRFICAQLPGHYISAIAQAGFPVDVLPEVAEPLQSPDDDADAGTTLAILEPWRPDWIVLDHYGLSRSWERAVGSAGYRILALDDLARSHDTDVVVDQNWFGPGTDDRYKGQVPPNRRLLLGPRYCLVQSVYAHLRAALPERDGTIGRVLVFFGGTDPDNQTLVALEALSAPRLVNLAVDVVLGANHPSRDAVDALAAKRPRTRVFSGLPTLAGLLARADLAIGAGGITTWERACLGVPSIVTVIALNQDQPTRELGRYGYQLVLGGVDHPVTVEDWRAAIQHLLEHPAEARALSAAAAQLTDGLGAGRVAWLMTTGDAPSVVVRRARAEDEGLLLGWANDPSVRHAAFDPAPISASGHREWFAARRADPTCLMIIGEDPAGLPLGQVRFDLDELGRAAIDVSVDPVARGCGVGRRLLVQALTVLGRHWSGVRAVADVKAENLPSVRLFLSSGFSEHASSRSGVRHFQHAGA